MREYETLERGVIIKDANQGEELSDLVKVYKETFSEHNRFQKQDEAILGYIIESHGHRQQHYGGYIVAMLKGKAIGGLLVKQVGQDQEGKHTIWKYNHLGVSKKHSRGGIGRALVRAADQRIKELISEGKINTAKVELGVSENEADALGFYVKCGFEIEGKLKDHYRHNELVYILGKSIE
jgi:ribosomal protein S18 acetylase RimI-like enzyme